MIYAKIYLDYDDTGRELLVFDSARESSPDGYLTVAYTLCGRRRMTRTTVHDVSHIAISPEAKAVLSARLADKDSYTTALFDGDFEMIGCRDSQHGWDSGMFAFKPLPEKEGQTKRILYVDEPFILITQVGFSPNALDYMTLLPNDTVKTLDLNKQEDI